MALSTKVINSSLVLDLQYPYIGWKLSTQVIGVGWSEEEVETDHTSFDRVDIEEVRLFCIHILHKVSE